MPQTRRQFLKTTLGVGAAGVLGVPDVTGAQGQKLVVWWNKGYYPEEDAAMQKIVKEFEASHKVEIDLSFTAQEDLLKKITAALIARRVPDVAFCFFNDWQVVPKFGWGDQLADVSDLIQALKPRYNAKMLEVAYVMNGRTKKRAYYGVPSEAIVKTLKWFGELFTSGYVPPDATNWTDGDNNAGFHSRTIVMTPNPSQSIPAAQFFNKEDLEKKNYFDNMATIEWPDGPDGRKAHYLSAVKTIILPKDSKNQKLAKDFIAFVVEKDRFSEYIKAANGRWFPAFTDVAADTFWRAGHRGPKGQKDNHVPVATTIFLDRENKVFEHSKHPAFSQVYDENVWGKAMARIAIDKWPADKAADEGIERMKAIFGSYK